MRLVHRLRSTDALLVAGFEVDVGDFWWRRDLRNHHGRERLHGVGTRDLDAGSDADHDRHHSEDDRHPRADLRHARRIAPRLGGVSADRPGSPVRPDLLPNGTRTRRRKSEIGRARARHPSGCGFSERSHVVLDVPTLLERVVLPVVRALIRDDETVDGISLRPEPGSGLLLTISIEGEPFRWHADLGGAPETEEHGRSRLASDLQDFVAESRFGWGQLRPHPF
jgi:hypothetical protein